MRIVVTGATGNVGTSVRGRPGRATPRVTEIVGLARRLPRWSTPRTRWVAGRRGHAPRSTSTSAGADAVIHLAWLIQPSRDEAALEADNVDGSRRVFEAAADAGVGALVHASSIGAYSEGPSDLAVEEAWPTRRDADLLLRAPQGGGGARARRGRGGAARPPGRPAAAGAHLQARGRFRHPAAVRRSAAAVAAAAAASSLPVLPLPAGLVVQGVHADDVAEAYRLAATDERARGAYNVAADPVLDAAALGRALDARPVRVPVKAVRAAADLTWRARLQPTPAGLAGHGHGGAASCPRGGSARSSAGRRGGAPTRRCSS